MFLPLSVCRLSGAKCPPAGADLGHDRQRQRRARSSHTRNATTRRHAHIYQGEVHTATRCSATTTRPPRSGHLAPRMRRRRSVWAAAASSEECEHTNNHARLPLHQDFGRLKAAAACAGLEYCCRVSTSGGPSRCCWSGQAAVAHRC